MNIHTWFSLLWSKYVLMTKTILIKTGLQKSEKLSRAMETKAEYGNWKWRLSQLGNCGLSGSFGAGGMFAGTPLAGILAQ